MTRFLDGLGSGGLGYDRGCGCTSSVYGDYGADVVDVMGVVDILLWFFGCWDTENKVWLGAGQSLGGGYYL